MDFQNVKSYKDLEILLKESSVEDIRANYKTIKTLTLVFKEKCIQSIDRWRVDLKDRKFQEWNFEHKFSEYNNLLPTFKEELDSMVECAKLTWNYDVYRESLSDEKNAEITRSFEKVREASLQQLDAQYNMLRFLANPHEVINELEKQHPRPITSNRGCMVGLWVLIVSAVVAFL